MFPSYESFAGRGKQDGPPQGGSRMMVRYENQNIMISNVDPRYLRICQSAPISDEGRLMGREMGDDVRTPDLRHRVDANRTADLDSIKRKLRSIVINIGKRSTRRKTSVRAQDRTT